ncbi:DUF4811 domain-containing protein [Enterococcus faecalis]|uniref:DUF4811 domain-containing protein n=1 Tax=Enterococcus faecalis TaxID=1351 RepID=UPI0013EFB4E1
MPVKEVVCNEIMIIFLLILCVLGFAYTNVFGRKVWHKCCMVIFGLGFLASLSLIVLNDKDHFGMTEVTQDKTFELKSSSSSKDGPNMLLYQPLGDGSEKVYLYNTPDKKKLQKTGTENVTNTVQKDAQKAHIKSKKRRNGPIKSLGPKTLFGLADNDNQFAKQENTFNVASDWLVLSADQAKKLGEYMEQHALISKKKGLKQLAKK